MKASFLDGLKKGFNRPALAVSTEGLVGKGVGEHN